MKSDVYEEVWKHGKIFISEKKEIKKYMHPMMMAMQKNSKKKETYKKMIISRWQELDSS